MIRKKILCLPYPVFFFLSTSSFSWLFVGVFRFRLRWRNQRSNPQKSATQENQLTQWSVKAGSVKAACPTSQFNQQSQNKVPKNRICIRNLIIVKAILFLHYVLSLIKRQNRPEIFVLIMLKVNLDGTALNRFCRMLFWKLSIFIPTKNNTQIR